ncbi:GcrA family cell cycle regulator [Bradyrhizobium sp. Ai1a-2]|uniref:GcrA family cell cycle regulator n=1 Tax=Bradyrhizobium sp. Ai1a-2 TaxID=196490 RepID=UPI0003F98404|nr:GcrA family cell cycle regulator [Bradyrhizobium sp. Ai1a-2]
MTELTWTDERVEQLKNLFAAGLSSSQIAAELGGGISRNAVIGKVHRLGLNGLPRKEPSPAPRAGRRPSTKRFIRIERPEPKKEIIVDEHAANMPDVINPDAVSAFDATIPVARRKGLMDLRKCDCRWPVGDPASPDFFFCGGPTKSGLPYCEPHCRVAYKDAAQRRQERGLLSSEEKARRVMQGKARAERMRRQAAAE